MNITLDVVAVGIEFSILGTLAAAFGAVAYLLMAIYWGVKLYRLLKKK